MQNSNLSAILFPRFQDSWAVFINRVEKDLNDMLRKIQDDEKRLQELRDITKKIKEVSGLSKDNIEKIMDYREMFLAIDESLKNSFDALEFFKRQNNFDSKAVRDIYERIITSPNVIVTESECNRLLVKIPADREKIKKYGDLIRGINVNYSIINELLNKYELDDKTKKDVIAYVIVMLSVKQKSLKNEKIDKDQKDADKIKFYQDRFKELRYSYQEKKEDLKDLLMTCFTTRKNLSPQELKVYSNYANNPSEIKDNGFQDEELFKIYTLAFFKIKKDIEKYIEGFEDLAMEENDLDDELKFFQEMLKEFDDIANELEKLMKTNKVDTSEISSNVFFALDAFSRLIIDEELLNERNKCNIRALLQKTDNINNSKIDGVKTYHMQGVEEEEKKLGKNISMIMTSKVKLAYILVNKNVLIISGAEVASNRFDRLIKSAVNRNLFAIKKQIAMISEENLDYIELQDQLIKKLLGEEEQKVL